MGQLAIVVTVDAQAALAAGTLAGNIYMVDNNKHAGSTGQGTENLVTHVEGTQIMNWLVTGLDYSPTAPRVTLEDVRGEAVKRSIMVPQQFESPELGEGLGLWWGATVDSNKSGKTYRYKLVLKVGDQKMKWVSHILVKEGFSNVDTAPVKIGGA